MNFVNCLQFSMRHLYNKKKLYGLSIMIISIAIIMIFEVFWVFFSCHYDTIITHEVLGTNTENIYKISSGYIAPDMRYYDTYNELLAQIKEDYEIGLYFETSFVTNDIDNLLMDEVLKGNMTYYNYEQFGGCPPMLSIDNVLLRLGNIKDTDKQVIQLFEQDGYMEVAVGVIYADIMPIGTKYVDKHTKQKYIVKCIIDNNQNWFSGEIYNNAKLSNLNHYIITGTDLDNYSAYDTMCYISNVYFIDENNTISLLKEDLEKMCKQNNMFINIDSFDDYEHEYIYENQYLYSFSMILALLLLVSSLIIVFIICLISWLMDFHDIGIVLANGFVYKDIFSMIFIENLLRLIVPMGFSYSFVLVSNMGNNLEQRYFDSIYFLICLLFIGCLLGISIVCYLIILKKTPDKLIRGER